MVVCVCAAAQDSAKVTVLREVAVSASRSQQPLIDIPRSVTLITGDVIEKSAYQSLGDLLNAESGMYVVGAAQTPGSNQNLFMRGSSSNQVAVMIDGVRITDPSAPNSAIDLSEISLTNVERVEIIRGSHSTMYGGAAIGGVINIITTRDRTPGLHGVAFWQGAAFGKGGASSTENVSLNYGMKSGVYFSGSLFQENARGLDASEKMPLSTSLTFDRDDFNKSDGVLEAGYRSRLWDASLSFKNVHQRTEIDNGAYTDDDNNYLVFDRQFFQYRVARQLGEFWRISLTGSVSGSERFYENDSSKTSATSYDKMISSGTYYGDLQTHELQFKYDGRTIKTVFGGGLYDEKMSFNSYFLFNDPSFGFESVTNYDTIDAHTATGYAFAQVAYGAGRFHISGGTRASRHSTAGNFLTFELSPSLTFGDLLVYASASTGFNAPSLYQLYDPSRGFSAYTTRGNRELHPERSLSLEAGMKKEFASGGYVTLSTYETRVGDAIEYVYLWNGDTPIEDLDYSDDRGDTYINAGESVSRGVEVEGFVQISKKLSIQGNVSAISTKVEVRPGDMNAAKTGGNHVQLYNLGSFLTGNLEQEHLVRRPDLTGYMRLSYHPFSDVTLSTAYHYTGLRYDAAYDPALGPYGALSRLEVKAYHLMDLAFEWDASKALSLVFRVENILNEEYREVAGFQTRGRSVYLKARVKW
jgi:vitamin B12 transporter